MTKKAKQPLKKQILKIFICSFDSWSYREGKKRTGREILSILWFIPQKTNKAKAGPSLRQGQEAQALGPAAVASPSHYHGAGLEQLRHTGAHTGCCHQSGGPSMSPHLL